jgi:general secretion pathway protein D
MEKCRPFREKGNRPGGLSHFAPRVAEEEKSIARNGLALRHPHVRLRAPILAILLTAMLLADDPSAATLYKRGRQAEKKGHMAQAYLMYAEAAAKDPDNQLYWQRIQAVKSRAAVEAKVTPQLLAEADLDTANGDQAEPDVPPEAATQQDLVDAGRKLPPDKVDVEPGTTDIDLRGDSKQLWTDLAKKFGLDCVFDADYLATPAMHFELKDVDYRVALRGLEAATGTFLVPLSSKLFLVAKDTTQKRSELEPRASVSIPLPPSMKQQDFNAIVTAVQQAVGLEKVAFDTQSNTVILRDTVAKVTVARALFNDLARPPGEVLIDLKYVEVSLNDMLTYGLDLPDTFSLNPLTTWLNNQISLPTNITGLLRFGGGKTMFGIGIMMPTIVATMSHATGDNYLDGELRSTDGQAATMHIGEQYPVMTSGYFGPASFTNSGTAYTPPPSFQFVDLGLTLKVTPWIHSLEDVTLDVDAEFKLLTTTSVNGIPVIANRAMKASMGLKMGEWAVLGGLLDDENTHSIAGIPGLARIPYLGPLTNMYNKTKTNSQILILMRPHLLSAPPGAGGPTRMYRLGSETRPITPL